MALEIGDIVVCVKWVNENGGQNFLGEIISLPDKNGYFFIREIWPHPEITESQMVRIRRGNIWALQDAPKEALARVPKKLH